MFSLVPGARAASSSSDTAFWSDTSTSKEQAASATFDDDDEEEFGAAAQSEQEETIFRSGTDYTPRRVEVPKPIASYAWAQPVIKAPAPKVFDEVVRQMNASFAVMMKAFFFLYQSTSETEISAIFASTKYTQRKSFETISQQERTQAAAQGREARPGVSSKLFFVQDVPLARGASYTPFKDFSKTSVYTDVALFNAGVNPAWYSLNDNAEGVIVFKVFRFLVAYLVMWNEQILARGGRMPEGFVNAYRKWWLPLSSDELNFLVDRNGPDSAAVAEAKRQNDANQVHTNFLYILQMNPEFFSVAEVAFSRSPVVTSDNRLAFLYLYAITRSMGLYAAHTVFALLKVRDMYRNRPAPRGVSADAHKEKMSVEFHRDKITCSAAAMELAHRYVAWSLAQTINRSSIAKDLPKTVADMLSGEVVALARTLSQDPAIMKGSATPVQRPFTQKLTLQVTIIEMYDNVAFQFLDIAKMKLSGKPTIAKQEAVEFVRDFYLTLLDNPSFLENYNTYARVASIRRYRLGPEIVSIIASFIRTKYGAVATTAAYA